jgi:hypothetical protein
MGSALRDAEDPVEIGAYAASLLLLAYAVARRGLRLTVC